MESPAGRFLGKSFRKAAARTFVPLIVFSKKRSELGVCLEDSVSLGLGDTLDEFVFELRLRAYRHVMDGSSTPQGPSTRHWVASSAMYFKLFPNMSRTCRETDDCVLSPVEAHVVCRRLLTILIPLNPLYQSSALHRLHVLSALHTTGGGHISTFKAYPRAGGSCEARGVVLDRSMPPVPRALSTPL